MARATAVGTALAIHKVNDKPVPSDLIELGNSCVTDVLRALGKSEILYS